MNYYLAQHICAMTVTQDVWMFFHDWIDEAIVLSDDAGDNMIIDIHLDEYRSNEDNCLQIIREEGRGLKDELVEAHAAILEASQCYSSMLLNPQ